MKGNQILVLFRLKIPRHAKKKQELGTNKKVATCIILLLILSACTTPKKCCSELDVIEEPHEK